MEEDKKVIIKLHKELLSSEKAELKAKRKRRLLIALLCFLMLVTGTVGGFILASKIKGASTAAFKKDKLDKIVAYFNEVWLYKDDYENLEEVMENKAFYGMTQFPEDKYSTYMSKEELDSFATSINQSFVGIGASYLYNGTLGLVTEVFKDSPAEKGGLLVGDILYKVNDELIEGLESDDIKARVQGKQGTNVNITVLRSGKEVELTMTRNPVEFSAYATNYDDIVYLKILSFGDSTCDECIRYLDKYTAYSKLIIDLRSNSGGYQDSVQKIAGLFIGKNKVVLNEIDNEDNIVSYETIDTNYYDNFKDIVVLTNSSTASAAEVLTICLKEQHPNTIQVGETTFGKGVVQSTYRLTDDSAIKITSFYWTSPNNVSIHGIGVAPDVEIELDPIFYESFYDFNKEEVYEYDSVSNYVKIAQEGLDFLGYRIDRTDGYFDETTKVSLNEYKIDNDLGDDGVLDANTFNAIFSSVLRENSNNIFLDKQFVKAVEKLG